MNPCAIEFNPFGFGPNPGFGQALDFTLDVGPVLSVNEFEISALSVYPIPAKDILNVEYKSTLNAVKIYNFIGQEVYNENTSSSTLQLDLSRLTAGAYIVKLITEEGEHNFRILKQ